MTRPRKPVVGKKPKPEYGYLLWDAFGFGLPTEAPLTAPKGAAWSWVHVRVVPVAKGRRRK